MSDDNDIKKAAQSTETGGQDTKTTELGKTDYTSDEAGELYELQHSEAVEDEAEAVTAAEEATDRAVASDTTADLAGEQGAGAGGEAQQDDMVTEDAVEAQDGAASLLAKKHRLPRGGKEQPPSFPPLAAPVEAEPTFSSRIYNALADKFS